MSDANQPTRVRYLVLAALCSLAFITYLDRICISQVQDLIAHDLQFNRLTPEDEDRLSASAEEQYRTILNEDDETQLAAKRLQYDSAARRQAASERLQEMRTDQRLSWLFAAFLVGYVLFEIPGGWLGDVWGPRGVILRIVIWWSLFTALTGSVDIVVGWFVTTPETWLLVLSMVAVRFLFGLGEAGAYPNIGRALARWFPYRERGQAQGFIWTASRIGGGCAPPIIIALAEWCEDWRPAFWLLGAIGAIWSVLFFWWFRDKPEEMAAVNAAEAALIRSHAAGAGSVYDDQSHHRAPWGRLLTSSNLWAIYLAAAAVSFSWYFNVTFMPRYLKSVYPNMGAMTSWKITMWPLLVSAPFCYLGGRLSDHLIRRTGSRRWGRSLLGVVGFTAAGVCVFIAQFMPTPVTYIAMICVSCALQDLAIPCIWSVCADVGGRYAGTVSGSMNAVGALGGALGNLATPYLASHGWRLVLMVNAAVYVLGGLLWLRIDAAENVMKSDNA